MLWCIPPTFKIGMAARLFCLEVPFRGVISEAIFGRWNSNGIAELFVGEVVLAQ